jgi:hypothetical protein
MANCTNCGNKTTKCGCKDSPLTTPTSYTCPPSDSCPDPNPCSEVVVSTCVVHDLSYGLPCLGVTAGMTLSEILQLIENTFTSIGDGTLSTSDEGTLVEAATTSMNFVGGLVEAVAAGANAITVNIKGDFIEDLDDTVKEAYADMTDLANDTSFNFLTSPPSGSNTQWFLDIFNRTNTLTYAAIFDPNIAKWKPVNLGKLVELMASNLYNTSNYLTGGREIGFNGQNLHFTASVVNGGSSAGGEFKVTTSGGKDLRLYTDGNLRINHSRFAYSGIDADLFIGYYNNNSNPNTNRVDKASTVRFYSAAGAYGFANSDAAIQREAGANGAFVFEQTGNAAFVLSHVGVAADAHYARTGQWDWAKYGSGLFQSTYGYFLGISDTVTGAVVEIEPTAARGGLRTRMNSDATTAVSVTQVMAGTAVKVTNAGAITVDIKTNAITPIDIGSRIEFIQMNIGAMTVTPAGGVSLRSAGALYTSNGQYSKFELLKINTDEWILSGNLV